MWQLKLNKKAELMPDDCSDALACALCLAYNLQRKMLYKVKGVLIERKPNKIVLNINGIALELIISLNTYLLLPDVNSVVEIFTSLFIREDAIVLFGFIDIEEKEMFHLLNKVSSIGPTLAINILSGIKPVDLKRAILNGDKNVLCGIPKIGKKTAERINFRIER